MKYSKIQYIWIMLRFTMGWTLLWAFLDKLFGLGFSTTAEKSWLLGNSPTLGFLKSSKGPFADLFQSIAGSPVVDWLFMMGLLLIGLALLFGIGVRIACYAGILLFFLMYISVLPPKQNPFLDDHLIYIIILLGLSYTDAGEWLGFGKLWSKTKIVKKCPILK